MSSNYVPTYYQEVCIYDENSVCFYDVQTGTFNVIQINFITIGLFYEIFYVKIDYSLESWGYSVQYESHLNES